MLQTSSDQLGPTGAVDDLAQRLVVTCARFTRSVARLSPHDSPTAVWRTLAILDEHGAIRVSDLAVLDRCSQPTATGMVQRLEADGAVVRIPDPSDGRATLVSLSDIGRTRLVQLREGVTHEVSPRLSRLSPERLAELQSALSTISELLDDTPSLGAGPPEPALTRTSVHNRHLHHPITKGNVS